MNIVDYLEGMTWRCDICRASRMDEKISMHKVDITPPGYKAGTITRNVKYCNDNPACKRGAENWQEPQR